jgi:hypothetical protein
MANPHTSVRWTVLAAATSLLTLAACGSESTESAPGPTTATTEYTAASPSPSTTGKGPRPVEVPYLTHFTGSEGEGWQRTDIITDGNRKVRFKTGRYDDPGAAHGEEYVYTWDGTRVLEYSLSNQVPYTVYEAPNEHPDEIPPLSAIVKDLWATSQRPGCTVLKTTKTLIGRVAVGYRCVAATPEPGAPASGEAWVDQETGIVLKAASMVAEKLVLNPKIGATTFSTQPPAGAKVTIIAAKNAPPGQTKKVPDFTLDLVKGGRIGLKDLAGQPFVLAFFPSELAFDESGDAFPGYRDALLTLQTLTSNGTKPRVLGVQAAGGMPMQPAVPSFVTSRWMKNSLRVLISPSLRGASDVSRAARGRWGGGGRRRGGDGIGRAGRTSPMFATAARVPTRAVVRHRSARSLRS